MSESQDVWPLELNVVNERRALEIIWEDGRRDRLDAEYLRVESPSAEVKGHMPSQKKTVPGKKDVTIQNVVGVGTYAIQIVFSDGHSTGIFSWPYLRELQDKREEIWGNYLAALAEKGLSR